MEFADGVRGDDLLFGGSAFLRRLLGQLGLGVWVDEVVLVPGCGRGCNDGVPDDGFGRGLRGARGGVNGFEVEEDLFRVPVEQAAEICGGSVSGCSLGSSHALAHEGETHTGIQVELYMRIFFPLGGVIMGSTLYHLHVSQRYASGWVLWRNKSAQRNHRRDCESNRSKESEDVLQPHKR